MKQVGILIAVVIVVMGSCSSNNIGNVYLRKAKQKSACIMLCEIEGTVIEPVRLLKQYVYLKPGRPKPLEIGAPVRSHPGTPGEINWEKELIFYREQNGNLRPFLVIVVRDGKLGVANNISLNEALAILKN